LLCTTAPAPAAACEEDELEAEEEEEEEGEEADAGGFAAVGEEACADFASSSCAFF
jgi:hypothetical protein